MSVTSSGRSSIRRTIKVAFRVVRRDGMGDVLEENRLTGPWRGDDQPALALAERRDQVDHARQRGPLSRRNCPAPS
jgi:hypothetical protein